MDRPLNTVPGSRIPDWLLDYGPVGFVALEGVAAVVLHSHASGGRYVTLALGTASTVAALLLRRRAPLMVLGAVLVLAFGVGYGPIVMLPVLLALFTVAEYRDRDRVIGAAVVAAVIVILTPIAHGGQEGLPAVLSRLVAVGLAVSAGLYLRTRAEYIAGLRDRAQRLERERELLSDQAVSEERVRIARELHDVVAHNVSLMVVQAQALAATSAGDREQQAALGRVADLGREAMSEMHRMLGVLRLQNGSAPERAPQPGVRDLEGLIRRTREAGIGAELLVDGEPRALPPTIDLSAYRIVQEALTNVIRHASADRVMVRLSYLAAGLELTVCDDGVGPKGNGDGGGHGIVGMRERVSLFGGELTSGAGAGGRGYRVHAVLPVG